MFSSLQPMPPLLEGHLDCKKFSVSDVVVPLRRVELAGEEGAWMEAARVPLLLRQDRSYSGCGGVHLHHEWSVGIRMYQERSGGEGLLKVASVAAGVQDRDLGLLRRRLVRGLVMEL